MTRSLPIGFKILVKTERISMLNLGGHGQMHLLFLMIYEYQHNSCKLFSQTNQHHLYHVNHYDLMFCITDLNK